MVFVQHQNTESKKWKSTDSNGNPESQIWTSTVTEMMKRGKDNIKTLPKFLPRYKVKAWPRASNEYTKHPKVQNNSSALRNKTSKLATSKGKGITKFLGI